MRNFKFLLGVLGVFLLSACMTKTVVVVSKDPESLRRERIAEFTVVLSKEGVEVENIGETMRIVIPSDRLFNPGSANINPLEGARILNMVAEFMEMLETTRAEVSGYTNKEPSPILNQALSERQAQVVLDYLWTLGLDARVLYARGFGANKPLARNRVAWINRRIEINVRYFPLGLGR